MQLCSASLSMLKPPQMRPAWLHPHPISCAFPFWLSLAVSQLCIPLAPTPYNSLVMVPPCPPRFCHGRAPGNATHSHPSPPHKVHTVPCLKSRVSPRQDVGNGKCCPLAGAPPSLALSSPSIHFLSSDTVIPWSKGLRGFWGLPTSPGQATACWSFLIPTIRGNGLGCSIQEHRIRQRQPHTTLVSLPHPFSMSNPGGLAHLHPVLFPPWPWRNSVNPLGINHFQPVKLNTYWASLAYLDPWFHPMSGTRLFQRKAPCLHPCSKPGSTTDLPFPSHTNTHGGTSRAST